MKKRLSSIMKKYKFDSAQEFYKEFNVAKGEYLDYEKACAELEKAYGDKVVDTVSIRDRLKLLSCYIIIIVSEDVFSQK